MLDPIRDAQRLFARHFGDHGRIHVVRSPGRVNLIGEHTDYNDGFVCPMAIEPAMYFAFRNREDALVNVVSSLDPDDVARFDVNRRPERVEKHWSNYVRGPVAQLIGAGVPLQGIDVAIVNTLPAGSGLSSSAALEVGMAISLLTLAGDTMNSKRVALLCQKAEHEFPKVPCGIMDQMIVAGGREGHAMLLDCRTMEQKFLPLESRDLRVVICNSMVKHALEDGGYEARRRQCEQGVEILKRDNPKVTHLRDVSPQIVDYAKNEMGDLVYRRCRHVTTEIDRCLKFADLLMQQRYEEAGDLMVKSHASLRDDYNVSTPELDFLVESAMQQKGVYGSRMTGGGFGGCTVSLVQPHAVEKFTTSVKAAFEKQFKLTPDVIVTTATGGASVIE
jgi:galactokinase